ncbi:hypothetical protein [Halobacillus andaensis]|uniref:hypothetical protein n=1 Tax=Halobacillus andaensis TaxID=1176239 RepID=UPI003D75FFFF
MKTKKLEVFLWSIAFPGFGQLLNHHYLKGFFFIVLEIIINLYSNFNTAILLSFKGETQKAVDVVDYQWLMFYPCLYMFAIWDAYKHSDSDVPSYSFLPFAFSAYTVTTGLMFSSDFTVMGTLLGPIWLPILSLIPGVIVGLLIRQLLLKIIQRGQRGSM